MSNHIGNMEALEQGTRVIVGNKRGKVVSSSIERAHPCGMIAVNVICLDEKSVPDLRASNPNSRKWVKTKPVTKAINYAGIYKVTA